MSLYVLDTDIVSLFQHNHPAVCAAAQSHSPTELAITVLTVEEQLSGWYKELRRARKPTALAAVYQRMAQTVRFYSRLPILSFPEPAILRYEQLRKQKLGIRKTDLRIAAIVLEQGATLVTRNVRDFQGCRTYPSKTGLNEGRSVGRPRRILVATLPLRFDRLPAVEQRNSQSSGNSASTASCF